MARADELRVMVERLLARSYRDDNGCLVRHRANPNRYARVRNNEAGRMELAHRVMYEYKYGPIPDGLEYDHLCRNKPCFDPDHGEPVTHSTNVMRSPLGTPAIRRAWTHCPQGHPFDEANTYIRPNGRRGCRACRNQRSVEHTARKRKQKEVVDNG